MPKISEIQFQPRATPEQVSELKAAYAKLDRELFGTSRTNFIVMYGGAGQMKPHMSIHNNQPCHGALGSLVATDRLLIITELAYKRNQWDNPDVSIYAPFLDWFVNRSYMSRFILNKDEISCGEDRGLVVSCDMSALLMQNIMITSRHFREVSPDCFRQFNKLVADGVDENVAYTVTMLSTLSTKTWEGAQRQPVAGYGGHRAASMYTIPALRRLIQGDYGNAVGHSLDEGSRFFSQSTNYYGGTKLFYTATELANHSRSYSNPYPSVVDNLFSSSTGFLEALRAFRKASTTGEMYKPPNPFAPRSFDEPTIGANKLTYEEFYAVAIPFILEELNK